MVLSCVDGYIVAFANVVDIDMGQYDSTSMTTFV